MKCLSSLLKPLIIILHHECKDLALLPIGITPAIFAVVFAVVFAAVMATCLYASHSFWTSEYTLVYP
jgi:uncharacterized membrane protein